MNATIFNALAEPNRLHIVELLRERPLSVNEIVEELGLSQPLVSKHLRALNEAGLVTAYPIARQRFYGIKPDALRELDTWISSYRHFWDSKLSILDNYLETVKEKQAMTPNINYPLLTIERLFNAPRDVVWQAWTKPDQLAAWWVPEYFVNKSYKIEARPGGPFNVEMQAPDGVAYPMTGVFKEVAEPERLVFITSPLDSAGKKLFEVQHTVTFSEADTKTRLTIEARVLTATPEASPYLAGMEAGMNQSLAKLERLLAEHTKGRPM